MPPHPPSPVAAARAARTEPAVHPVHPGLTFKVLAAVAAAVEVHLQHRYRRMVALTIWEPVPALVAHPAAQTVVRARLAVVVVELSASHLLRP